MSSFEVIAMIRFSAEVEAEDREDAADQFFEGLRLSDLPYSIKVHDSDIIEL